MIYMPSTADDALFSAKGNNYIQVELALLEKNFRKDRVKSRSLNT